MKLKGKVALVTGATSGIGRAIAQLFTTEGASVVGVGRRSDRLRELQLAHAVAADLRKVEEAKRAVDETVGKFGKLNILVNSAGVIGNGGILTTTPEEWRRIMDINLESMFHLTRLAAPHLIKEKGNSILNLSSVCSLRPYGNLLAYCISKAATDMFTQCLALELAPHGVRVNALNPGVVVSELHRITNVVPN